MNNTIRLRKTLFSLTLIFILTVSLLPTSVEATNGDSLLIDGVDIINKLDHKIEYTNGGYVKYDIDTNTLELNNASIEPSSTKSGITGKISGALTINVIGKNNITLRNSSNETRGIFVETDTLIINGTDKNTSKLAISILNPIGNVDAIYSSKGIISINNIDCEIEAQGVTNTNAVGINSNSNELNISDSNISMKDMSYGIILEKTKAIISNSKLDCNENLQYIFGSDSNLFINDSIVNSVSNSQYSAFIGKEYFGIFDVTINNSTFDILDKTIVAGISVDNLIINNGSVINIDVAGIGLATSKSMIISDSTIIVDSFSTRYNAIYSEASIDIKDSTIDASSDGAAILVSRTVTDGEVGSADINLNGNLAIQGDLKISNCLNSKRGFNFTSFIPNSETQLTERGGNGSKVVKIYIKDADYSAVTAAINNIPKDLSIYTDASVKSL
ncbi:MAG: hypothetical protein RSG07_06190, partial [Erysipelotrichaceae bacterium]